MITPDHWERVMGFDVHQEGEGRRQYEPSSSRPHSRFAARQTEQSAPNIFRDTVAGTQSISQVQVPQEAKKEAGCESHPSDMPRFTG